MIDIHAIPASSLLTPAQTSELLAIPLTTLNLWRCTDRVDLPYIKIGRQVRYQAGDIIAFLERGRRGKAA